MSMRLSSPMWSGAARMRASDMRAWAERVIGPREFPRLDEEALAALRALLTFTWR